MTVINKKEPLLLAFGDIFLLAVSLMGSLILRYQSLPSNDAVQAHIFPFILIFTYSILTFYIAGLYGRAINLARNSLPGIIIRTQIVNGLIAVLLFYFIPAFSVTPKITLFIYIIVSSLFVILWRLHTYSLLSLRRKQPALIIGSGKEVNELIEEMDRNPQASFFCKSKFDPQGSVPDLLKLFSNGNYFRYIFADLNDARVHAFLPELYKHSFPNSSVIDIHDLYEEIFDKIPLSRINYTWIMSYISSVSPQIYDIGKRIIDTILACIVAFFAILFYPFVAIAIKLDDGGPVFIKQIRLGKNNRLFTIYKYRTMSRNDSGQWLVENKNKVTRVGQFIRKSRIDELPQALSVLKGDMSLIGPRADIIDLGNKLGKEIPYYSIRTVIKPGLSGWAQVNQEKPPQSVEETKIRLSYDLYYIKHRSLGLDFIITLKTIKTLLSRVGM